MADVPTVRNQSLVDVGYFAAGQTLLLLVGFVLGALIRNSSGAIVAYLLYGFVVPGLLAFLAFDHDWFADARPWVDAKYSQDALLRGELAGDGWSHLAVTSVVWLVAMDGAPRRLATTLLEVEPPPWAVTLTQPRSRASSTGRSKN